MEAELNNGAVIKPRSPFSVTLMPYSPTCTPTSAVTTALLKDL